MAELLPARLTQLRTHVVVLAAVLGMLGTAAHKHSQDSSVASTLLKASLLQVLFAVTLLVVFRFTTKFWMPVAIVCALRSVALEVFAQISFPVVLLSWLGMVLTVAVAASVVLAVDATLAARRAAILAKVQLGELTADPLPDVLDQRLATLRSWLRSAPSEQAAELAEAFRSYSREADTPAALPPHPVPRSRHVGEHRGVTSLPAMVCVSVSLGVVAADVATGAVSVVSAAALAAACLLVVWQLPFQKFTRTVLSVVCVAVVTAAVPFLSFPSFDWIFLGPVLASVVGFLWLHWLQRRYATAAAEAGERTDAVWAVQSWRARHVPRARRELASFVHTHLVPRLLASVQHPLRFDQLRVDALKLLDEALQGPVSVSFEDTAQVWRGLVQVEFEVDEASRLVLQDQVLLSAAVQDAFAEVLANAYRHAGAQAVYVRVNQHVPRLILECRVLSFRSQHGHAVSEVPLPSSGTASVGLSRLVELGATIHEVTVRKVGLSWPVPVQVLGQWHPTG